MVLDQSQFKRRAALDPVEYPILRPWEYLDLAVANGLTQQQAKSLSGFDRGTWYNWLYSKNRCPEKISRAMLEKLHRIAEDYGWIVKKQKGKIRVRNKQTNVVYDSLTEAARLLNYTKPALSWQVKHHPEIWEVIESESNGDAVRNKITEEEFPSIRQAAIAYGIHYKALYSQIKRGSPDWEYIDL